MFSIRKARAATPHDFVAKSKPKKSKGGAKMPLKS